MPATAVHQNWFDAAPAPSPQAMRQQGVNVAEHGGCTATTPESGRIHGTASTLLRVVQQRQIWPTQPIRRPSTGSRIVCQLKKWNKDRNGQLVKIPAITGLAFI